LPETLQKIFQCPQAHDEHSSNLQRATFRPDPPPPVAGNFAKIFQMSMGAINISCKASYLPASQQAAICGAQQRLEGMGQVRADILGCLDGTQFFLAGLNVPGSSKGARSGGMPSRHEKMAILVNFRSFHRDQVKIEQSVIERTRLEIFFQIISVLSTFELGGRPGP
jgi:hypothetical protein